MLRGVVVLTSQRESRDATGSRSIRQSEGVVMLRGAVVLTSQREGVVVLRGAVVLTS